MIKELTELVNLVQQGVPKHEDLLRLLAGNQKEVLLLFRAIADNQYKTDEEVIRGAGIGARTSYKKYGKLLREHLLQLSIFFNQEQKLFDEMTDARLDGFRLLACSKILMFRSSKHSARHAARLLLDIGLQYDRPEFVAEAAKILMDYVLSAGDKPEEFDHYADLYQAYAHWRLWEEKAFLYCCKIRLPYIRKKSLQPEQAGMAAAYVQELESQVGKIPSHCFHLYFFSLKANLYLLNAELQQASRVHDEAIAYFESRPYPCHQTTSIFYCKEAANGIHMEQIDRAEMYLQKALLHTQAGSLNWFYTQQLAVYLFLHKREYGRAAEVYAQATKNKRFASLRAVQHETWHILGAYLYLVQKMTHTYPADKRTLAFKSSRFLNEVPICAQDKNGMNIPILIAHILLQLLEGRDVQMWDRTAALEKYRERYLRDKFDNTRADLFLKTLTILAKSGLDRQQFLRKAQPCLEQMKHIPRHQGSQTHELEIVPYEHWVELILQWLPQGKKYAELPVQKTERGNYTLSM